jgi:hypothetical protein
MMDAIASMPRSLLEGLVYQVVLDHLVHLPAGGFATLSPAPGRAACGSKRLAKASAPSGFAKAEHQELTVIVQKEALTRPGQVSQKVWTLKLGGGHRSRNILRFCEYFYLGSASRPLYRRAAGVQ